MEEPEALAELAARRAELMRRIRDANRRAKRGRIATIAVSTIIAVVAPAFALFFSDQLASGPFWLLVWLSVLAAGLALATWWMEPENLATNEVELLALIDAESQAVAAARALAASGAPYALFLRSFDSEVDGLRTIEEQSISTSWQVESYQQMAAAAGSSLSLSAKDWDQLLRANSSWTGQLEILRMLQARLSTVLLGNTRLDASARTILERSGIVGVHVFAADWWDLVRELARNATLIVVFIDRLTQMLAREVEHLSASGDRYVAFVSPAAHAQLSGGAAAHRAFLERAAGVVVCRDYDAVDLGVLAEVLERLGPAGRDPAEGCGR